MEQGGEPLSPAPWFTLEERLFFSGFCPDPADGVGIESDLGEQFVSGGDIEFEVMVEHGVVSCSGVGASGIGTGRPSPSPMPGVCPALASLWLYGKRTLRRIVRRRSQAVRGLRPRPAVVEHGDTGFGSDEHDKQRHIERRGFWLLALLWLPAGVITTAALRFAPETGPEMWAPMLLMSAGSLMPVAPCGLPLALGCRRLWRRHS